MCKSLIGLWIRAACLETEEGSEWVKEGDQDEEPVMGMTWKAIIAFCLILSQQEMRHDSLL